MWGMKPNGYVYETFGISKHFPVKLQELLIRAETLDNSLTAKCFIYDVGGMLLIFIYLLFDIWFYFLLSFSHMHIE
jgi:high-affinity K+ transport system ATPase subunit B